MSEMLKGLRVADLSIVTAGAMATQVLADFGADVVKIEGVDRPDMYRGGIMGNQGGNGDLDFPPFRTANRNKRDIAVDLKSSDGLEIVKRLIATSDVVVENFRRGVIERLGLGFQDLIEARSNIVLVSVSSQGATGPNSGYTSFGATLDALGGIMSFSGYDESTPTWSSGRVNYPDQTANTIAPAVILAAVMASRHDGQPRWVDLSQREVVTSLLGEWILKSSLGDPDPVPMENSGPGTIEWLTRCSGTDRWVAISADGPGGLDRIAAAIGTTLAEDAETAERVAALRTVTDAWSSTRSREEVAETLQLAGIAAVPVNSGEELLDDPYLRERGWWQTVALPDGATEQQRGWVVQFSEGGPTQVQRRAPHLGQDTDDVLAELGYSDSQIGEFHDQGIVSSTTTVASHG